ncbi:MAG: hypothetical protein ACXV79_16550 [Methylobacter sp.]
MNAEQELAEQRLSLSRTFNEMVIISRTAPVDIYDNGALSCFVNNSIRQLVTAMDSQYVHFDNEADKTALLGLLAVLADVLLNGHLKNIFNKITVQ